MKRGKSGAVSPREQLAMTDAAGLTGHWWMAATPAAVDDETVGIGEVGVRSSTEFWKTYPDVNSRLWDLNGLRHIVTPGVATSIYGESDTAVKQHDVAHVELTQLLQTKRGPDEHTVDWMRLNMGMTWFADNDKRTPDSGPYRYLWNNPMTPLRTLAAREY